eukprot:TRINITY_DN3324_c0_g1_i2.p1 TRINITY_DN3324_c0_g1~~TRINITY_DN3324_c0_g1_i2.p1  ORF type:complete len:451 (+),score=91.98 TRINITY_DN3324_c0_g1_i2:112-1464(+)
MGGIIYLQMETPENRRLSGVINSTGISSRETLDEEKRDKEPSEGKVIPKENEMKAKVTLADFEKIGFLGRGSYSEVSLVRRRNTFNLYALKMIDKGFIAREKKQHQVFIEREVLTKLNHPNIVKLHYTFQDKFKLYFVLDYLEGGSFAEYISIYRKLSLPAARFYTAEIVRILEHLHSNGIAHRDIKPSNLMLSDTGHLTLIDFGTAKFVNREEKQREEKEIEDKSNPHPVRRQGSFIGTAQYVAPEMLERSETGTASDLWALGCVVYEILVGYTPFVAPNEFEIFDNILSGTIRFPNDMDQDAKDLILKLLAYDPSERLGAGPPGSGKDFAALKAHPFFKGFDFDNLDTYEAPYLQIASPFRRNKNGSKSPNYPANNDQISEFSDYIKEDLKSPKALANEKVEPQVIIKGTVEKKCGWIFFRPRTLILYSDGKLESYDPEGNVLKVYFD